MTVVACSQFVLSRTRRNMAKAIENKDWRALSILDGQLTAVLDAAFADEQRDAAKILDEMTRLLKLYKQVMANCEERQKSPKPELFTR